MTVFNYSIGYVYDPDSCSVTVYVNEADSKKRVHSMTVDNVDNSLKAFLHYTEYCDYLTNLDEYWFLCAVDVLTEDKIVMNRCSLSRV
jgi:hypothetical protein